ncbi:MAG TPA: DUF6175 family protein [Flavobacterium sp.]|nr:DUF6175 family protein [Flavobacterium sp.]HPJ10549.1 DUF6175 family protein [Flavobacterium sp.]
MKQLLLLSAILLNGWFSSAQTATTAKTTKNIQPKIMVIPRVPDGVNMKEFYDKDVNMQIAIAKVNEAFLNKGAKMVSFDQALKQLQENAIINKASNNSSDVKSMIVQKSSADIYVEVKMDVVTHSARNAKSVNLILDAYQAGTSNVMSSKNATGPMFQTDDVGQLTTMAIDKVSEEFLNLMQLKFDDIVENGQSVFVQFTANDNAKFNLDSEINGTPLSLLLDEWFNAHAVNGIYNNQGSSTLQATYSDVRIPLRYPANPNANYTAQYLYNDIMKYLKSLGITCKKEVGTNNKLIISIL